VRARTGSVVAPIVVHALSNLLVRTLEVSFYR
jgi:membrane protease YdiL (CAAX protease family)